MEFTKLLKQSPVVLVDIIFEFIGNGKTRYCDECKEITDVAEWVYEEDYDTEHCPNCYFKCDNTMCEEVFNISDVHQVFDDGENINFCEDCLETETFFCDLHKEHILYVNQEQRTCVDCDRSYCDTCFYDEDITYCESCSEYSCCRKFIRIRSLGRDEFCERCVEPC